MSLRAAALVACAAGSLTAPALAAAPSERDEVPRLAPLPVLRPAILLRPLPILRTRPLTSMRTLSRRNRARALRWRHAWRSATAYVRGRRGRVSVALVDDQGRMHGFAERRTYNSASLVKAMLLVAYLRRREIRHRSLSPESQALLAPMIQRSDNAAATRVRGIVGNPGLARLARRAGMHHFASAVSWGDTQVAAADQARFFMHIDRLVPPHHRPYARLLLASIVREQRWGIPAGSPHSVHVFFKGGWRPEAGAWLVHQAALVEKGDRRVALAVLTDHDRSDGYGHETVRGVAKRLLGVLASG